MMDNFSLRLTIVCVLIAASVAVLEIDAGQSAAAAADRHNYIGAGDSDTGDETPPQEQRSGHSNGQQRNWYANLNQQQQPHQQQQQHQMPRQSSSDVVQDDFSNNGEFYQYKKRPAFNDYDSDANRELENMPFGVQNVRSALPVRPSRGHANGHSGGHFERYGSGAQEVAGVPVRITFQSLCPSRRETVFLNLQQSDYEYRPNHYDEVYCTHPYAAHQTYEPQANKVEADGVCGTVGFHCLQLNRTIFLTRKPAGSDCWESETRLIPAGCECMWPKHRLGDIGVHH